MSKNPLNILFQIIFFDLLSKVFLETICDSNFNNNPICEECIIELNNYSKCKYKDLYCILTKGKNIYSQCKLLFSRDLRKNIDNNIICGEKDFIFTNNNYTETIFQLKEETLNNFNDIELLHCDYDLKVNNLNHSSTNKINITISFENTDNNKNNFNFFFFLLKNNIFNPDNLITKDIFFSSSKTITLEYFQNISLYLDINIPKNYIIPKFSIKIDYINFENEDGEEIEMAKEDMYPLYLTLYIAVPLLILLIALIIYLCCKKQDTGILGGEIRVIGFVNMDNEIQEENENNKSKSQKLIENKKKLMILFKTILGAQEYTKTQKKMDCPKCTICYDDFELNNSVVSITPCQHIFHYRCLHNWLNKNAIHNLKCPNCNFDLMSIDINQLRQKMQNNSLKREGSVNENLLSNNNIKNTSNNNCINLNSNINDSTNKNNTNERPITITHISLNYNLTSNKKTKDNESGNYSDSEENEQNDSNENENKNDNIYSSQNRLNDEDNEEDKKRNNLFKNRKNRNEIEIAIESNNNSDVINDNNMEIKTIIHKRKKRIIISPNESKDDNDENIDKININNENVVNNNKLNSNKTSSVEFDIINNNNNTNQKKEGYKTLNQDIVSSSRRVLH